jgi:hypothetical protein
MGRAGAMMEELKWSGMIACFRGIEGERDETAD